MLAFYISQAPTQSEQTVLAHRQQHLDWFPALRKGNGSAILAS
jgi:uncharacterized protein YciI